MNATNLHDKIRNSFTELSLLKKFCSLLRNIKTSINNLKRGQAFTKSTKVVKVQFFFRNSKKMITTQEIGNLCKIVTA
jgi:hypothetical protein